MFSFIYTAFISSKHIEIPPLKTVQAFDMGKLQGLWQVRASLSKDDEGTEIDYYTTDTSINKIQYSFTVQTEDDSQAEFDQAIYIYTMTYNNADNSFKLILDKQTTKQNTEEGAVYETDENEYDIPVTLSMHIIALDKQHYNYAIIANNDLSIIWILTRANHVDKNLYASILTEAMRKNIQISTKIHQLHWFDN